MNGAFEERMEQLRVRFRARAGEDRARLVLALTQDDLLEARRISHGVAGSAGVFGYPELSQAASAVEEAIDGGMSGEELRALAARLLRQLEEAAQPA
jgi:HPt (histidine-containing phosphotransfer) domain-containing protein